MEFIREALNKSRAAAPPAASRFNDGPRRIHADAARSIAPAALAPVLRPEPWQPPLFAPLARHLENERIVSYSMKDRNHVAFNLLRTRVRKEAKDNGWRSIAITSPTPGCGKTMVALNLAISLSRAPDCRVVLVDLDLRKPAIARALGISPKGSLVHYLEGRLPIEDCFVKVNNNLVVGLNERPALHSSEAMQSPRMDELIAQVTTRLEPDILLFDLPPMAVGDDALAFLPRADATLMVIAAGVTTATQVDECERQISQTQRLLGVVLNKCEGHLEEYYS